MSSLGTTARGRTLLPLGRLASGRLPFYRCCGSSAEPLCSLRSSRATLFPGAVRSLPTSLGSDRKLNLFCGAAAIRHPLLTSQLPAKTAPPSQRTAQRQRPITFGRAGLPEPVRTAGSVLLRRGGIRSGLAAPADSA